jgi:lipid-A-disaccharide synthase
MGRFEVRALNPLTPYALNPLKYYLIAGEASGDLHGAKLTEALRELDPTAEIRAWGGDLMQQAGADVVKHYRELAFMGFVEVVMNLRTILGNLKACQQDIEAFRPDRLVLIDYPGFNLRMAKWARKQGYDISYYISPQIWAWHTSRVHQVRKNVDRMLVILPFEEEFYAKYGVKATFVGHPLLDVVAEIDQPETATHVALLPGSRKQEISRSLPIMLAAAARVPDQKYVIAGAPGQSADIYQEFTQSEQTPPNVELVHGQTYRVLAAAHTAMVTSGTATLETALFGVPQVVCYRGNALNYWLARRLVASRIKYISLVNLVMDAPVVPELIQEAFNVERLTEELQKTIAGPARDRQLKDLAQLRKKLGEGGAARRAAAAIVGD